MDGLNDDNPSSSITDELRKWASDRHCKGISHTDMLNIGLIADRIDEQFDRICQQHEAVLQETIDGMVKEYEHDRLPDQLRIEKLEKQCDHLRQQATDLMNRADAMEQERDDACAERDEMKKQFAKLCVERADLLDLLRDARKEYMRLRTENQIMLEDIRRRQAKLDEFEKFDADTSLAAFGDDNDKLRRLLSRAAKLLEIAEHDRDTNYAYWMDCKDKVVHANITIDELQAKLDEVQRDYDKLGKEYERTINQTLHRAYESMELPKDMDGTCVEVGDTVRINDREYGVYAVSHNHVWLNVFNDQLYQLVGYPAERCKVIKRVGNHSG